MNRLIWILSSLILFTGAAQSATDVRTAVSTSCTSIPVHLGIGMTTQIVLEQEPKVTLFADKKHFKIITNASSPRSLAIIPLLDNSDLDAFKDGSGRIIPPAALVARLNESFKTNLFVFFENNNQLMFELSFVERGKVDYVLKVTQDFNGKCSL